MEINVDDENINIEKYKNELMNNFSESINNLDNLENIEKNELKVDDWNLKYNNAINKLTKLAKIKLEKMKKNHNDNNVEYKEEDNIDFKKEFKKEINNINNISISINDDPFKLFKEINEKEKSVLQMIKKENKENNIIDDMFFNIEKEIDDIIYNLEEEIFSKYSFLE